MRMPAALAATSWLVCWLGASSGSGAPAKVLRYLALGDSYTIGEGIEPAGRWPVQLAALLRRRGLGVNDQYRGGRPENYRPAFSALLRRAITFAGGEPGRMIVLSIPDWSVTSYAIASGRDLPRTAREIRRFNEVNREETERAGARWVDVTGASERALGDSTQLARDGLHPSVAMYAEWARLALPAAAAALAEKH